MPYFNIAGISIKIILEDIKIPDTFIPFTSYSNKNPDLKIQLKSCENISLPKGKILMDEGFTWLQQSFNNNISVFLYRPDSGEIAYMLNVNEDWNECSISFLKNTPNDNYPIAGGLGEILFRNNILFHQGIVIHAAAIKWKGKGIIFSAPSETGKSTQARLWQEYMGAEILNGDRPAVRIIDNHPKVYGTPWSGSSSEYLNNCAPLSAIVLLEQSTRNSIRRLSNSEAVLKLLPRTFLPYFNNSLVTLAITNIERIITSTPIYLLKCKPDREAVHLVHQSIELN